MALSFSTTLCGMNYSTVWFDSLWAPLLGSSCGPSIVTPERLSLAVAFPASLGDTSWSKVSLLPFWGYAPQHCLSPTCVLCLECPWPWPSLTLLIKAAPLRRASELCVLGPGLSLLLEVELGALQSWGLHKWSCLMSRMLGRWMLVLAHLTWHDTSAPQAGTKARETRVLSLPCPR